MYGETGGTGLGLYTVKYNFDDRLPMLLERLKASKKRTIITIHCVRPSQFCDRGMVDEDFVKRIAELADVVIVHLNKHLRKSFPTYQQRLLERISFLLRA